MTTTTMMMVSMTMEMVKMMKMRVNSVNRFGCNAGWVSARQPTLARGETF